MKLFVLISTLDNGIKNIPAMLHPQSDKVHYCIVWQQTEPFKTEEQRTHLHLGTLHQLIRKDVSLKEMDGTGLSRSRNMCLKMVASRAEKGVCILADDDEKFEKEAFTNILQYYELHPHIDIALFRIQSHEGFPLKTYPPFECDFNVCKKNYYPSSLELSFRTTLIEEKLTFDERFGLGSAWLATGEEDIWLYEAVKREKLIRVVPITIASTDADTTGKNLQNIKVLRSKGAIYGYTLPRFQAWLRTIYEVYGLRRKTKAPFSHLYRNIWSGVKYITK